MYQACVDNDVVITFCHQRRFGGQFIKAKELANDGTIGQLRRVEGSCANMFDWGTRLVGTDGIIEVGGRDLPPLRVLAKGYDAWRVPDLDKGVASGEETVASVLDLVDCLENGREPELSGRKALRATELIFATYESSRRRAKIELPLEGDDSALLTMLEMGTIGPER